MTYGGVGGPYEDLPKYSRERVRPRQRSNTRVPSSKQPGGCVLSLTTTGSHMAPICPTAVYQSILYM